MEVIKIGAYSTISQYSYLCTASHDYRSLKMPLVAAPITIGERVWITADVFVGPGVTIGEGSVVLARSTVLKSVDSWMVVGGNPAKVIKARVLVQDTEANT
jgi:putative colanic acid biosynthesis acetyltransferase WcaF